MTRKQVMTKLEIIKERGQTEKDEKYKNFLRYMWRLYAGYIKRMNEKNTDEI